MAKPQHEAWTTADRLKADRQLTAFGKAIKKKRLELQMNQEDLANAAGLHRTYISDLERGVRNPTIMVVMRLQALQVDPRDFLSAMLDA
jgi:transcriptional regulator with XRE-family HTH domain